MIIPEIGMRMSVRYLDKSIALNVKETGFLRKAFGLMFRTRNTDNLLFDFKRPVHRRGILTSWFVFFEFLVVWLDGENKVLEWRICRPFEFSIRPSLAFNKAIEIPANRKNDRIIDFFVGKKEKV